MEHNGPSSKEFLLQQGSASFLSRQMFGHQWITEITKIKNSVKSEELEKKLNVNPGGRNCWCKCTTFKPLGRVALKLPCFCDEGMHMGLKVLNEITVEKKAIEKFCSQLK